MQQLPVEVVVLHGIEVRNSNRPDSSGSHKRCHTHRIGQIDERAMVE